MYQSLIRPVLFLFDPERVHRFAFGLIGWLAQVPGVKGLWRRMYVTEDDRLKKTCFGITFPNPVGLAAGFDKDAERVDELACFGFGFVEIGTVTPRGQPGNGKPRLFRLPEDGAIINRMGFNNAGVEAVVRRLRNRSSNVIVGGNIGKNKTTPNEEAFKDYEATFNALFDYVDYFVVNVSSPNTPDLRALQDKEPLSDLLIKLQALNHKKNVRKPVLLKIAPDLNESQLTDIVDIAQALNLDGLIATNTTVSGAGLTTGHGRVEAIGAGGISGRPLRQRSTDIIRFLRRQLGPDFPIIGVGGIMSARDALEKIEAGASLVQVYTGFVYEGPGLVKAVNKALLRAV